MQRALEEDLGVEFFGIEEQGKLVDEIPFAVFLADRSRVALGRQRRSADADFAAKIFHFLGFCFEIAVVEVR